MSTTQSSTIGVRPFESSGEVERMIDYYLDGEEIFLRGMGVDPARLPTRSAWLESVMADLDRPDAQKKRMYLAWLKGGELIGHSSMSHIVFGVQAHVHLHIWRPQMRSSGLGTSLLSRSLDLYFKRFALRRVFCEPHSENLAPIRTVLRLGFRLIKQYQTTPTGISLEHEVTRCGMTREAWIMKRSKR